jgi:PBP1b-binding outer membrane lipoprotein LpoB
MKNLLLLAAIFILTSAFSVFRDGPYTDSDHGNFYLRNGKVYFQKTYNTQVDFTALEKKLISYNSPNSGFQIKRTSDNVQNGVMVNYNLNWNYKEKKTRKIEDFLKNPANGTFEVSKIDNAYQVIVNNIWFTDVKKPSNKNHVTLESIVTGKGGVIFTKDKKTMKALEMIDENFEWIFQMQGSTKDTRF